MCANFCVIVRAYQLWWNTLVIPALRRMRLEDWHVFEVSLDNRVRSLLKKTYKQNHKNKSWQDRMSYLDTCADPLPLTGGSDPSSYLRSQNKEKKWTVFLQSGTRWSGTLVKVKSLSSHLSLTHFCLSKVQTPKCFLSPLTSLALPQNTVGTFTVLTWDIISGVVKVVN